MPWPIRYHPTRPDKQQPGDIWPAPWLLQEDRRGELAPYYWQHNTWRPPLIVRLPGHAGDFCVDGDYGGETRAVTGDPPGITVSPSIHAPGLYHGWLQNGILSDDVEGRKFDQ